MSQIITIEPITRLILVTKPTIQYDTCRYLLQGCWKWSGYSGFGRTSIAQGKIKLHSLSIKQSSSVTRGARLLATHTFILLCVAQNDK